VWPPNLPDLNPVDYKLLEILQETEGVQNMHHCLDELIQQLGTEWAKLDRIIVATAISGIIAYQRVSRPVVDILNDLSDFHHCTATDFLLQMLTRIQVTYRPILVCIRSSVVM